MRKRFIGVLMLVMMILTIATPPQLSQAATVKINKKKATMEVDSVLTLKISGTDSKVTWKSSSKKIAKVSSKGKVTALKEGTATITAKVDSTKYTCVITVVDSNKEGDSSYVPTPTPTPEPEPSITQEQKEVYSLGAWGLVYAMSQTVYPKTVEVDSVFYKANNGSNHRQVVMKITYKNTYGNYTTAWVSDIELDEESFEDTYYNNVTGKYVWITMYSSCPYAMSYLNSSELIDGKEIINALQYLE